jgi:penicillin-binding protein 1A
MLLRYFGYLSAFALVIVLGVAIGSTYVLYHYGRDLPDYKQLAVYEPPLMTRVHAADGRLMYEYAREHRLFVPLAAMPAPLVQAFLSAEDKNFYSHPGIDVVGVARAIVTNIRNLGQSRRLVGASTITQQVAKNFLLSNIVTIDRKVKEAILAFRIERAFDKDRILELYLNQIYLGRGSYGIAAASLNYFNKALDELTLAEVAYLAALPKAPNNYHPVHRLEAAITRRNWVLSRMQQDGRITERQAYLGKASPLVVYDREATEFTKADYFTEGVRRQLYDMFGEEALYEGGLSVRTSLDPQLQGMARKHLQNGLITYDRRHGWRGPIVRINVSDNWLGALSAVPRPRGLERWRLAVVLALKDDHARIGVDDGLTGVIPVKQMQWARAWIKGEKLGKRIRRPADVLKVGDVIAVAQTEDDDAADSVKTWGRAFSLKQIPEVEGAIVAMDPHTGRVVAMVGGYSFRESEFNRATQARRQPGSAFKPFVYTAALDAGFTPSSLILDEPFVIDQGQGLGKWRPANYTKKFYGPSTLRLGIEKSRNLMTVRLAQYVGMDRIVDYAQRFGVVENMPEILSMSLGAGESTLIKLSAGYATLVNGGKKITPSLIDRIQDRRGQNIYRHDTRPCEGCSATEWRGQPAPDIPDIRETIVNPATAYQMVSILQGVVQRGTGVRVRAVGKPLAGKTGTTNDSRDTWFVGFSPDLAVGVFVGFDNPRSLGEKETGSNVAGPIFRDFMADALREQPSVPFRIPPGIRLVRVNARTGLPAQRGERGVILEAFKPGTEPTGKQAVLDGSGESSKSSPRLGTGGLY